MPNVRIFSPRQEIPCDSCGDTRRGVIIRKVGDTRQRIVLCGRCLALAMQDITKQNWLSQWTLWQANSKLGSQIRMEKRLAQTFRQDSD